MEESEAEGTYAGRGADRVHVLALERRSALDRGAGEGSVRRRVQTAVAAVQQRRVRRDERVGVGGRRNVLPSRLILVGRELLLRERRVVLLEMRLLERLAERQLLRVADAQVLAQVHDGPERVRREVDAAVQVT